MLHKHKDLRSIPRIHILKKPCSLVHTCNPTTGEVETRGCLGLGGQYALASLVNPRSSEKLQLKKQMAFMRNNHQKCPLALCTHVHVNSTHMKSLAYEHTYTHTKTWRGRGIRFAQWWFWRLKAEESESVALVSGLHVSSSRWGSRASMHTRVSLHLLTISAIWPWPHLSPITSK